MGDFFFCFRVPMHFPLMTTFSDEYYRKKNSFCTFLTGGKLDTSAGLFMGNPARASLPAGT